MDEPNVSGSDDKPWDYPWTTDEMRTKRREWSLAADAGLLKHLEHFHNTITKRAKQTEEDLSSLTNQLNQTAILVDNVTNTSLALANNQFVESRVQEDDVEISKPTSNDAQENNDHELSASELIATVTETILKGLEIMDKKYEKVEVDDSDSEDDAENTVPSVILKPKDPYQDRPLPYVIGTEKWKMSTKIGLEYSSSEDSEQEEEEEEEEEENDSSESESGISKAAESPKVVPKMMIRKQISSSLSGSDDFEVERGKVGEVYNATEPSTESITPSSFLPKNQINGPPSFAEELAKRLGSVLPEQKVKDSPVISKAEDEESLFSPESEPEVDHSDRKTDNLFNESENLFDDDWSEDRQRPSRSEAYAAKVKNNFIPVSNDLPPPMNEISSKPKLAIDDLFGDVESDDSDDIFTPKTFKKPEEPMKIPTKEISSDDDDDFLFSNQKSTPSKDSVKKVPPGGVSIFGNIDVIPNSLAGKFPSLQRHLSSSSDDDTPTPTLEPKPKSQTNKNEIDGNKPTSMAKKTEPSNIDRSAISKSAVPQFAEPSNLRTCDPPMTPATKTESVATDINKRKNESIFDDDDEDDLFGPPPLPKTASSQNQKVTSIFDDSDSDKDLFDPSSRPAPNTTSIFDDDDDVLFADTTSVTKTDPSGFEQVPEIKQQIKTQRSIFDDSDEEDIFSPPKPTTSVAKTLSLPKAEPPKNTPETEESDTKMELEPEAKMESEPEAELEKAEMEEAGPKAEESVPDGAVISKKSSPVPMGVRMFPTLPLEGGIPKRPVSNKINSLIEKMGKIKILSPTDTPPLVRKKDDSDEDSSSLPSTSPVNSDDPTIKKSPSVLKRENSEENAESAVSFDEPVKSETLSSASKNRARIPTKRRPQSRHARQSALRHSGIDFDVADAPRLVEPDRENSENTISDRLTVPSAKSSTNKNTLRSPSTDEEDLFDMPPDLPEDTLREDPLFGRAPILSPSESPETKDEPDGRDEENKSEDKEDTKELDEKVECEEENVESPKDPLRDTSHDPLQDPSQFFAFVTRTPSPEKTKIIFNDDDSLFSSKSRPEKAPKNNSVSAQSSIFDDDDDSDLFSKSVKRPLVDKKVSLFDDDEDDDNDDLFGSKVSSSKEETENESRKRKTEVEEGESKTDVKIVGEKKNLSAIFDDDEDLVFGSRKGGARKKEMTGSNLKDIFGDQSSGDEDLFSTKSGVKKSEESEKVKDLKKTAEKISHDPLSLLQDD